MSVMLLLIDLAAFLSKEKQTTTKTLDNQNIS